MSPPPACPTHRSLVEEAFGSAPTDAALERYAAEVPGCAECRKRLAVRVGAHPSRFDAPLSPERWAGMERLARALRERPARGGWWAPAAVAAGGLAAAAVGMVWWGAPVDRAPSAPAPVVSAQGVAHAPVVAPSPASPLPSARRAPPVVAPARPVEPHGGPLPLPGEPSDDAVAMVDDWPPPPFEDLRGGTPKGPSSPVRSIELVLSGEHRVGGTVDLTVVSSTASQLAVCVTGPERGVVWRGAIPAGRVELTRAGRPVRFAFAAPGRYEWVVATDPGSCARPVHRVEVEVVP